MHGRRQVDRQSHNHKEWAWRTASCRKKVETMPPEHMHNISTLLKRLEAVTSRLEDIVTSPNVSEELHPALESIQFLLHPITNISTSTQAPLIKPTVPEAPKEPVPRSIEQFDLFLDSSVGRYVQLSRELGGSIARQAEHVLDGFREQRNILVASTKTTKLDAKGFQKLLEPMNKHVAEAIEIKERSRGGKAYNHLSCVADGIGLLGWIRLELRPYRHVDEYLTYAQYFGNKVLTEYKGK